MRNFGLKPHKPVEPVNAVAVTMCAEMVVVIAIFLGAAITVNGHAIWAVVVGIAE